MEDTQQNTTGNPSPMQAQPAGPEAPTSGQPVMGTNGKGKGKLGIIIGVCVLVALSAGAYFMLGSGQKDPKPQQTYVVGLMLPARSLLAANNLFRRPAC